MFSLTRSGLSVSVAVVFEALPVIMFGAVAGAVVDRLPRRRVMLVADVVRCGLALLMAQTSTIPAIYALAFCLALAGVLYGPAYQALLPVVVPGHVLGRANALSWWRCSPRTCWARRSVERRWPWPVRTAPSS